MAEALRWGPVEHLDMAARIDEGHGDWPEEG